MPSQNDTHQQPFPDNFGAKSKSEIAREVSERELREWIAERLEEYFEKHPEHTTEYIADSVGVSASSVSRWRRGESGVGVAHRRRLFEILQIDEQDLAKELKVSRVKLPDVRTRGAVKTRGRRPAPRLAFNSLPGIGAQAAAKLLAAAGHGNVACPERILAVFVEPVWPPNRAPWLAEVMRSRTCQLSKALEAGAGVQSRPRALAWRADDLQVFMVREKKADVVQSFLRDVTRASSPSVLILLYTCGPLVTHDGELCLLMEADDDPIGVASLLEQASGAAGQCLMVVEGASPDSRSLFGRLGPLQPAEIERVRATGAALMLSPLPDSEDEVEPWSFFADSFIEGVVNGQAGGAGEAFVSALQFYRYWEATLSERNALALERRLRGEPSAIVPAPYFLSSDPDGILIPRRADEPPQ